MRFKNDIVPHTIKVGKRQGIAVKYKNMEGYLFPSWDGRGTFYPTCGGRYPVNGLNPFGGFTPDCEVIERGFKNLAKKLIWGFTSGRMMLPNDYMA